MDITTRGDVELLVKSFYDKVTKDETIGPIFNVVAKVDWSKHLPVMFDFWETMLLDAALYKRNAMDVHYQLNRHYPFRDEHFARWLQLFFETVDDLFSGPVADMAKKKAKSIAGLMQFKMKQDESGLAIG
jgi:hemoglobin